jgi:hypothetical protein
MIRYRVACVVALTAAGILAGGGCVAPSRTASPDNQAAEVSSAGLAIIDQAVSALRADVESDVSAAIDAALLAIDTTNNITNDVWIGRGVVGVFLALVVWFARRHANRAARAGYWVERARRLAGEEPPNV